LLLGVERIPPGAELVGELGIPLHLQIMDWSAYFVKGADWGSWTPTLAKNKYVARMGYPILVVIHCVGRRQPQSGTIAAARSYHEIRYRIWAPRASVCRSP
jgi:hypothetical protein